MNEEILKELKVEPVDEKLRRYKSDWLRQVTRMKNNRLPKKCWIIDKMDKDDFEYLRRDY